MSYIELNSTLEYNQGVNIHTNTHVTPSQKKKKKNGKKFEIWLMLCMLKYLRVKWWWYGLPRWQSGKDNACQCRRSRGCGFYPRVGQIPWNRKWQPTPVFLLGKSMDRGAWWLIVRGVTKSQTWLSNSTMARLWWYRGWKFLLSPLWNSGWA